MMAVSVYCQNDNSDVQVPQKASKLKLPLDSIYQGTTIKFDVGSAVYMPVRNKGNVQTYDFAVNVQLFHKYFPVFEAGYAQAGLFGDADNHAVNKFFGYGGFMRLGADYSVLKKYRGDNHLFVGLRVGTSLQGYSFSNLTRTGNYWNAGNVDFLNRFWADAWGEVVAGVQVKVYKGLNMGWYIRYKILFTRGKQLDGIVKPAYILGFGKRDDSAFGWNYYIGWRF